MTRSIKRRATDVPVFLLETEKEFPWTAEHRLASASHEQKWRGHFFALREIFIVPEGDRRRENSRRKEGTENEAQEGREREKRERERVADTTKATRRVNNICERNRGEAYLVAVRANCPRPSGVVAGARFRFPVSPPEEPRGPGSPSASPPPPRASRSPGSCRPAGIKGIRMFFFCLFTSAPQRCDQSATTLTTSCR
mgnify:CR=1 FL=1